MARKTICDICGKDLIYYDFIQTMNSKNTLGGEYCEKCWFNSKNWKNIHKNKYKSN